MITTPRTRALSPLITRSFEFNRIQEQTIASAYEVLIPTISAGPRRRRDRANDLQSTVTQTDDLSASAVGA
jgi:hypothetical protein